MLSEEEKDAIKLLNDIENNCWTTKYIMSSDSKNAKILLKLITRLQNKIYEKDAIIEHLEFELGALQENLEKYNKKGI